MENKIPPGFTQEEVDAYRALKSQQAPPQAQQPMEKIPMGFTPEEINAYRSLKTQQAAPIVQTPMQTQQADRGLSAVDTSMRPQESLNNQSSNVNFTAPDEKNLQLYNGLLSKASLGAKEQADFWNTFSPEEKQSVGKFLNGAYSKAPPEHRGALDNLIQGLGNSARSTMDSFGKMGAYAQSKITGNDKYFNDKNSEIAQRNANNEIQEAMDPSIVRDVGKVGGDVAQLVGGGVTSLGKAGATALARAPIIGAVVSKAPNLTNYAIQGAVASVAQNPGTANMDNFISEKLGQAGVGAAVGGGAGVLGEKAIGYVGGKIQQARNIKNAPLSPADQAFEDTANKAGITELLVNDFPSAPSKLVKQTQTASRISEDVSDKVIKQQNQVNAAVDKIANDMPAPEIAKIAEETGLNKALVDPKNIHYENAKKIAKKIDDVDPNDPNAIWKVSNEAKLAANKFASTEKYDLADSLIPANTKVPFTNIEKVLEKAKLHYDDLPFASDKAAFQSVITDLDSAVAGLKSGKDSFQQVSNVFKSAGAKVREAKKAGEDLKASYFTELKNAVNSDKDAFINSLPDKTLVKNYNNALQDATNFNRLNVQNIKKDDSLLKMFSDENSRGIANLPNGIIEKWVAKGNTGKLKQLWDQTPESGKQAVQQGVFNKLKANSLDKNGDVNYQNFINNYKAYKDPTNGQTPLDIVFDANSKHAIDNLMRTLGNLKNYGYNKMNPQNGALSVDAIKSGNANTVIGAVKYIGSYLKSQMLVKGITDKKFQRILLNLNNINPSRPAYTERLAELTSYMAEAINNNDKKVK